MKPFLLIFCWIFTLLSVHSQDKGSISGKIIFNDEPVEFINIGLLGTNLGSTSDSLGHFHIKNIPVGSYQIIASGIGYETFKENIEIQSNLTTLNINLKEGETTLAEVVVSGTMKEVSKLESPVPIEVYTPLYFQKNPTPALFEALQIVNGVRPQVNCSVCNTGDIHINGMEGPYTMILIDGMPIVSGLSTVYGLNGIPNSMVERIEVVKGPASTLYGSEAVGGLINVITKVPSKAPVFSVDVFGTSWAEINTDLAEKFNVGKSTSMVGVNYFDYSNPIDNNGDGFTDLTNTKRISVFNKWSFGRKSNKLATLAGRYVYEDRWGGEMDWTPAYRGGDEIYGESIYTERFELIGNYQLPINTENVMLSVSLNSHYQNSVYGDVPYLADQKIAFGQLIWDKEIGNHDLLFGAAMRYTYYDDNTPATRIGEETNGTNNPENTYLPGIFVQDEITLSPVTKLLLGMRYDHNSQHGNIFTPRFNLKWAPNRNNIFRFSGGTGYRVVNLFTEDHAATTGTRNVIIAEKLSPEQSINLNLNYQKFVHIGSSILSLDASLFHTRFFNKIIPDYDSNPSQINYSNLDGYAISQGFTLNTDLSFSFPLVINAGITLLDVYAMEEDEDTGDLTREEQYLTEKASGTWTVSYTFDKSKISLDYTGNVYGPMKLPLISEWDERAPYSPTYSIQNIKISKAFKNGLTIYGGVKNLLNFTPAKNSIARPWDPFDRQVEYDGEGNVLRTPDNPQALFFDPAYVYTSNQGIRGFIGLNYIFGH
ncbi:TonB-dependent receptor [Flexithrix dorotheae]|uniref:TonB-dependent receptor n=1 Tax=Flexithrix dorotheae TaxID=70993 RepID=UPI0003A23358|nr:TonB-dependent receptor [Flexithrix dorotheae]